MLFLYLNLIVLLVYKSCGVLVCAPLNLLSELNCVTIPVESVDHEDHTLNPDDISTSAINICMQASTKPLPLQLIVVARAPPPLSNPLTLHRAPPHQLLTPGK